MNKELGDSLTQKTSLKRKEGTYELPEVTENVPCPVCSKVTLKMTRTVYALPDGDEVLIMLLECTDCKYKRSDIVNMKNAFLPGIYTLTVDDADFTHKVFRGTSGILEIPEIGISIERGPAATFDFTNIEGILLKMQEQLDFFLRTTPIADQAYPPAMASKQKLDLCIAGKMAFTVILEDPEGGSYISPVKLEKMAFIPIHNQ